MQDAIIYHKWSREIDSINAFYKILKHNTTLMGFKDLWDVYYRLVKLVMTKLLPSHDFDFDQDLETMFFDASATYQHSNFDELKPDATLYEILRMTYHSIKNLRRVGNYDLTNRTASRNADLMRRTSYLLEIEIHFTVALHRIEPKATKQSMYFTTMCEYMDNFHSKFDVVSDLRTYLKLVNIHETGQELHDRFKLRVEQSQINAQKKSQESLAES